MSSHVVVFITVPSRTVGQQIAQTLVGDRLVACVNIIGPISSVYRWKDAIEEDEEFLLVCKTTSQAFGAVADKVQSIHPYEVPEIVSLPIAEGLPAYLQWVTESTQ